MQSLLIKVIRRINRLGKVERLRSHMRVGKFRAGEVKEFLDKATKVRFTSADMAEKIKYGTYGTKGLVGNGKYQSLSVDGQKQSFSIVDQECARQEEWAPKQLPLC